MKISLKEMNVGEAGRVMGYAKSFLPYQWGLQYRYLSQQINKYQHVTYSFLGLVISG